MVRTILSAQAGRPGPVLASGADRCCPERSPLEHHLTHAPEPTVRAALRSPKMLRTEVLAGLVVALALIPEAISFSIIAGVDPRVGLFASFTMAVVDRVPRRPPGHDLRGHRRDRPGHRPGGPRLRLDYLIATVLLGGLIQIALGLAGVARLMRFIPARSWSASSTPSRS